MNVDLRKFPYNLKEDVSILTCVFSLLTDQP